MKLNKVTIICLAIAGLLTGGVLLGQASGFVTYENGNKIIFWDNVRLVGQGLNIGSLSTNPGDITIGANKDLYIKKFAGFDCPDYPAEQSCAVTLGDIGGNIFLTIGKVSGINLTLNSSNGISLVASSLVMNGKLILTTTGSLFATNKALPANATTNGVYADNLRVNEIGDLNATTGLTLAWTKIHPEAYFLTYVRINYTPPICTVLPGVTLDARCPAI